MIRSNRPGTASGSVVGHLPLSDGHDTIRQMSGRMMRKQAPMQRNCALITFILAAVVLYSFLIPFTAIHNITVRIHLPSSSLGLPAASMSNVHDVNKATKARGSSSSTGVMQWDTFWASAVRKDLENLQSLKTTIDHMRYQRLTKDVEYQDTAGLDVMLASSLRKLGASTQLYKTQEWLRSEVTEAVFAAINKQQSPQNCSAVKKLVCNLGKNCGFGCELHHASHCLSVAVATNRTMVLKVYPSNYIRSPDAWEDVFALLSSCTMKDVKQQQPPIVSNQAGLHDSSDEVFVGIIDSGAMVVDAPAMPSDVQDLVQLFHGRPHIWWQGILVSWLLRPSNQSQLRQANFRKVNSWLSPIVGVHIRRTDKLEAEAKLHQVAEYMTHVERFCDVKCSSGWQQRALGNLEGVGQNSPTNGSLADKPHSECSVYLASDEISVVAEVKRIYSHIHVITNPLGISTGSVGARYTSAGLLGVYDDIIHLANTDFLVGTFSSQVSRLAYEVAQVNNTNGWIDGSFQYHSVDSPWYFGGQQQYKFCLAQDYTDQGQQKLKAGREVICPVIYEYKSGYMMCHLPEGAEVSVPPGSLMPCRNTHSTYRQLLPAHMHIP